MDIWIKIEKGKLLTQATIPTIDILVILVGFQFQLNLKLHVRFHFILLLYLITTLQKISSNCEGCMQN